MEHDKLCPIDILQHDTRVGKKIYMVNGECMECRLIRRAKAEALRERAERIEIEAKGLPLGVESRSMGSSIYNWRAEEVQSLRSEADAIEKGASG